MQEVMKTTAAAVFLPVVMVVMTMRNHLVEVAAIAILVHEVRVMRTVVVIVIVAGLYVVRAELGVDVVVASALSAMSEMFHCTHFGVKKKKKKKKGKDSSARAGVVFNSCDPSPVMENETVMVGV